MTRPSSRLVPRAALSAVVWMVLALLASGCQTPSTPDDAGPDPGPTGGTTTAPIPQIAGEYTLTIGGGICKWSPLPWDLMNRTYRASIRQHGASLNLSLSEANFLGLPEGAPMVVFGQIDASTGVARFEFIRGLQDWDEKAWAQVTEVLPDGSRLEIEGSIQATPDASGLSGIFQGRFNYSSPNFGRDCESDHHRVVLTRN